MKKTEIQTIKEVLKVSKNIAIVFHFNPDGDAVGCALALYHYFRNDGYEVTVISPNFFPSFLNWMQGSEQILIAQQDIKTAHKVIEEADILFVVDMNAPHRAGRYLEAPIVNARGFKILIDHHVQPDIECDIMYSTAKTSSSSELAYNFLYRRLTPHRPMTLAIAEALYVGIITDTGSLSYACDNSSTYLVLNKLIRTGVNGEAIHRKIYDNYTESRMHLLGLALSERLKVMPEYATSYIYLTKKDLRDNHFRIGDTEGFVNYGLSINCVKFTAMFTEQDERIRLSFRSKGDFDTNMFARKFYQGGGHRNASGAFFTGTLQEATEHFEKSVHACRHLLVKE